MLEYYLEFDSWIVQQQQELKSTSCSMFILIIYVQCSYMSLTAVIFLCLLTVHKNSENKCKNLRNIASVIILKYIAVFYLRKECREEPWAKV